LAAAGAVAVVCASGAAHAAHVGVFVGGAAPGYYAPAPYYYPAPPPPPPPPQYIQRGPDGQPEAAPGPDGAPPYPPQDDAAPYPPGGSAPYPPPQGAAPQYPDDDDAPPQGTAPQYPQSDAPQTVTPQTGGNTWYYCDASNTYYPYVKDCTSGWRPVPAQPAQQ
jgi:hypothetical protein